eukprot:TRINITY_DN34932_c0_g1_i2.p1 TRINITY_DN34932_c0_g1~~TRINITY_DN34932_c0_g1_i2.p1  ORF type:complete len:467 (-),score=71.00 TRINITY_DN34932_c0_g1_i2:72-1319(-)
MQLQEYPLKAKQNTHTGVCCLPSKLVQLIQRCPWTVSHSVEALCDRDAFDLFKVKNMQAFSPEKDRVLTVPVQFNRFAYAKAVTHELLEPFMAKQQSSIPDDPKLKASVLGMKICLGYEILIHRHYTDRRSQSFQLKETSTLIEGIVKKLQRQPQWDAYILQRQNQTVEDLVQGYLSTYGDVLQGEWRWAQVSNVMQQLQTGEFKNFNVQECDVRDGDDDSWLREGMAQVEEELCQRDEELKKDEKGNQKNMIDAEELAQKFEDFLNTSSGFDGAEDVDQTTGFDPDLFWKELEKGLGCREASDASSDEDLDENCEIDEQLQEDWEVMTGTDSDDDDQFVEEYDKAMRTELMGTMTGIQNIDNLKSNLVENLVRSMNEQGCSSGPAQNLSEIVGVKIEQSNQNVHEQSLQNISKQ